MDSQRRLRRATKSCLTPRLMSTRNEHANLESWNMWNLGMFSASRYEDLILGCIIGCPYVRPSQDFNG